MRFVLFVALYTGVTRWSGIKNVGIVDRKNVLEILWVLSLRKILKLTLRIVLLACDSGVVVEVVERDDT